MTSLEEVLGTDAGFASYRPAMDRLPQLSIAALRDLVTLMFKHGVETEACVAEPFKLVQMRLENSWRALCDARMHFDTAVDEYERVWRLLQLVAVDPAAAVAQAAAGMAGDEERRGGSDHSDLGDVRDPGSTSDAVVPPFRVTVHCVEGQPYFSTAGAVNASNATLHVVELRNCAAAVNNQLRGMQDGFYYLSKQLPDVYGLTPTEAAEHKDTKLKHARGQPADGRRVNLKKDALDNLKAIAVGEDASVLRAAKKLLVGGGSGVLFFTLAGLHSSMVALSQKMAEGVGGASPHSWPLDSQGNEEDLFAENRRLRWVVGDVLSDRAQVEGAEQAAEAAEGAATSGGNAYVEERRVRQRRE